MRSLLLAVCCFFCCICQAKGQSTWSSTDFAFSVAKSDFKDKRVVPPSPEAADLGKYGNVPVSLFTGTPKISIPLFDLKGNNISVPLSLSYNSTGFKPEEIASWVGLAWTLNAGGVVTRSVMGNPDNNNNYFFSNNTYATPPSQTDMFAYYDYINNVQKGLVETQPDMYFFNFNGHCGKFFLKPDLTVVKKEKDNLKITAQGIESDGTGSSRFTIVDEEGNVYLFAATEISQLQVDDGVNRTTPVVLSYRYPSSWFLTSITSADGQETVKFNYYSAPSVQTQYVNYLQNSTWTYSHSENNPTTVGYETFVGINASSPPVVTITGRKYLNSINLTKGLTTIATVNFDAVANQRLDLDHTQFPGEQLLQSIRINSIDGLVKKFNFTYSYFSHSTQTNFDHKRLRLDAVTEMSNDGSQAAKPSYAFAYNTGDIPSIGQPGLDHWGYYNQGDMISSLVPYYTTADGSIYGAGADRDPNPVGASLTMLTQIKYPTGGYTNFVYESNSGKDSRSGAFVTVGGMRIKQIVDYSFGNKQAIIKNYSYILEDGATSSGVVTVPQYFTVNSMHQYYGQLPNGENTISYLNISANSVFGLGSYQGSHIGYSRVIEYQTEAVSNQPLGKSVYNYNLGQATSDDDDIGGGDLIKQEAYDNGGALLDEVVNTYNYANTGANAVYYKFNTYGVQDDKNILCKYVLNGVTQYAWKNVVEPGPTCTATRGYTTKYYYSGYVRAGQLKQLVQQIEKKYDKKTGSYITLTRKLSYSSTLHTYPTAIEDFTSNNEELVTVKKYAGDFVPGTGTLDDNSSAIQLLQSKNILGAPVEVVQYRQKLDYTNKRFVSGTLNVYYPTKPNLKDIYRLEFGPGQLTTLQNTVIANGVFSFDPNYKLAGSFNYDAYGNLSEQTKVKDLTKSVLWDYGNFLPSAEIINANANMVAYSGFENGATGGGWSGINTANMVTGGYTGLKSYQFSSSASSITKTLLPAARIYTVSYWTKGSAISVTTNIGATSGVAGLSFNGWNYFKHLLAAGSTWVTASSISAIIDDLKLYPNDAIMSTYTYKPLIGISSRSTPSEQSSIYEYDVFSRLINIKDMQGNIVKNFVYNYGLGADIAASSPSLFYNPERQQDFTPALSCPVDAEPTTVTYKVPYGTYGATTSATALTLALDDIIANGQAYANRKGSCLYWNDLQSGSFSKDNCSPSSGGSVCSLTGPGHLREVLPFSIAPHTYSSTLSKTDANSKAITALNTQGQANANAQCWCSCGSEGQKVINGNCETGVRSNSSSTQMSNGQWKCVYFYSFSDGTVSQYYVSYTATPCPIL